MYKIKISASSPNLLQSPMSQLKVISHPCRYASQRLALPLTLLSLMTHIQFTGKFYQIWECLYDQNAIVYSNFCHWTCARKPERQLLRRFHSLKLVLCFYFLLSFNILYMQYLSIITQIRCHNFSTKNHSFVASKVLNNQALITSYSATSISLFLFTS